MAPLLPAPLLLPLVPHPREQEQQENAEEGEEQRPRPTPTTMEKKVSCRPSEKKKFVDLKSMWARAEKKLKSIVDSNNISEHSVVRKDTEPTTHAPATENIGCSRACEVGFAETETHVPYESIEVSRPQDVDGNIEISKPHVANSESKEEDCLEDVDEDVGFIPHDPGKRIAISDYSVNQQDEVRMKYIALGPCRPPLEQFPQRNCGEENRRERKYVGSWRAKPSFLVTGATRQKFSTGILYQVALITKAHLCHFIHHECSHVKRRFFDPEGVLATSKKYKNLRNVTTRCNNVIRYRI
ncbi:hypothetical protein OsI_30704 [Oryza sativa Indica Group]|uniref:Uncharacterized protein n=1 Tax=Oryza sativa subsp. indica TaxID=39946 RepID=A2YZC6_ORYSI|nr:hypothetical protein OsI_30704 [Oryza sativa Indica Group]